MYSRIIVGTDGSSRAEQAVEHAATLARQNAAELHLVIGSGSPVISADMYATAQPNPAAIAEACRETLEPLAQRLRDAGDDVTLHVCSESGVAAICNTADDVDGDLIVVGNRGMSGARRLLGSVPNSVAHHTTRSVLIVPTD